MKIDLPKVDWQSKNWNVPGQLKKMFEEAGEVAEAVALQEPENIIRGALDTMQTCDTLINMVLDLDELEINLFLQEHKEKLERKGYL